MALREVLLHQGVTGILLLPEHVAYDPAAPFLAVSAAHSSERLRKGRPLHAQDIGILAAAGITSVPVFIPWTLTVISTGDEYDFVIRQESLDMPEVKCFLKLLGSEMLRSRLDELGGYTLTDPEFVRIV